LLNSDWESFLKCIKEGHEVHGSSLTKVYHNAIPYPKRHQAVLETMEQFKKPVDPTNSCSPYLDNSDSDGDCKGPPQCNSDKKNTASQKLSINAWLEWFIEALPHLESIHYAFCLGKEKNSKKCCLC
jgi:hypothetical protein